MSGSDNETAGGAVAALMLATIHELTRTHRVDLGQDRLARHMREIRALRGSLRSAETRDAEATHGPVSADRPGSLDAIASSESGPCRPRPASGSVLAIASSEG
jgi:hypothetical protein